ncbi:Chloride Channel (ClC) Family [Phytophthora nicotianae]|uniref:Chloride Channel (ClC) Family n=1 Tax=Phytophthora nicotianae TaxID=4792 RepID=A0A0W8DJJ5_PHYNI|nr:Chloride Channel (ClC) Family [Phytophthora nicotianae]
MKLLLTVTAAILLVKISTALHRKLRIARGLAPLSGPSGVWLLGNMPAYIKNRRRIYHFLITDPKDVQHILSTNVSNYVKPQGFLDAFQEVFANSFFAMNHHAQAPDGGAGWRLQRKVAAKVFTTANFRVFTEKIFARHAEETLNAAQTESFKAAARDGNQSADGSFCCDIQEISARYTLQSIFDVAFGLPLSDVASAEDFAKHMSFVNEHCAERLFVKQYYKVLRWIMPSERELRWSTREIRAVADAVLLRRLGESEAEIKARSDLLSLFICKSRELAANDQCGTDASSLLGPETLRSIILTFVFAGRDTTAECLTYSFYAIARHPKVQKRIAEELETAISSTSTPFTFEDVKNMKYLEAVVYEAVRLYPALPYNVKSAVKDDYLPDGTFVPAGVDIVYSPWFMGRNGAFWGDNPLEFRPERWLEMTKRPSAFEFPAFQAGPRICLGMNMAVLEAKLFLATTLRRFHIAIAPGEKHDRGYVLKSGLFMDGGLPLQLTPRPQRAASA